MKKAKVQKMREKKKLINVFDDAFSNGIFNTLQSFDVPWKNEGIAQQLDLAFITNYGARKTSPLIDACLDENGKLTAAKQTLIASTLYNLHKINWIKQYNTLLFDYNPIENYSMVETHSGTDTTTDTPTQWKETETQTPTNWKQTTVEGVGQDGYHEIETQTPTQWTEHTSQTVGQDGYHEIETQTPTQWTEHRTETVGEDGYTETETQTPTNWKETTTGLQADNIANANNSVYAFNSNSAVKVSESESKVSSKSDVERTGTYETEHSIAGSKEFDTTRTGTYETDKEITGSKETDTTRTGTYETDKEITGSKETDTTRTGTYETDKEITGSKETETSHTGTFKTETEKTGTYEKEIEYNTTLTRSGNIGVTTSQQMIESERQLWLWNFFQNVVFKDICSALTLSIY